MARELAPDPTQGVGRFNLLASAIAGRLIDVAAAGTGEPAWTDGATVFVDASLAPKEQLRCVAVQASLLGAGSLAVDILAALSRRGTLCRRFLAVEGHRALAAQEPLLPSSARALIDPVIAARSDSPVASLGVARSRDAIAGPPGCFGTIRPRLFHAPGGVPGDGRPTAQLPSWERTGRMTEYDDDESVDGDDRRFVDLSSPIGGGGGIGRLLKRLLGETRSGDSGPPGADSPTRRTRRATPVSRQAALTTAAAPSDDAGAVRRRGYAYPEWDCYQRRYRLDWCSVTELDPEATETPPIEIATTYALRRPLARVALDVARRRRQLQGDDIDIDATVDAMVGLRAGSPPDDAVYVDNARCRRDLAALLLLDISGSAGEPSATGAAVHEQQRAAAAMLTVALHDLGDRVALYAFRSMGRSAVHVVPVKRFDDASGPLVLRRLGALVPGAYTRLGAAIRHGAQVLEDGGGTGRRLLVVLSDGFAYDHGYEGRYGEADARRALGEARRRGTGCLCLSIGAATDAGVLRRVFGTAAHASIPRLEQLPTVVGPLFRSALRSAEVQRRAWRRTERTRERAQVERRTA